MRFSRLVIEADQSTVSLDLHPRLTVVAGVDERVRTGLTDELIAGLTEGRAGTHLDVADDAGRRFAISRPRTGAHRVVDAEGSDVTSQFQDPGGRIDLLMGHGIDPHRARELLYLDRSTLEADSAHAEIIGRLATLNSTELWSAAARVRLTNDELQALANGIERSAEDSDLVDRVEERHQSLEAALELQVRIRRHMAQVSTASVVAALAVGLVSPIKALPILMIGMVTALFTFVYRARVEAARRSEESALAEAGAESYLGFVVQRVDGIFTGTEQRRRLVAMAEDHRKAAVAWTRLAGNVTVDWALAHHDEIEAASHVREELRAAGDDADAAIGLDEKTSIIANALVTHLSRLRRVGPAGESFPLILDDPFAGVPTPTKVSLLELLARSAGSPQIILLTDQDDVAAWARNEARTGELELVEPQREAHAHQATTAGPTTEAETQTVDTGAVATEAETDTADVETDTADTDTADTETADTDTADTETADTEPADTETADTEPADTEPVAADTADTETADTEPVAAETAERETDTVDTETAETEPVGTVDTEPADTGTADTGTADTEVRHSGTIAVS